MGWLEWFFQLAQFLAFTPLAVRARQDLFGVLLALLQFVIAKLIEWLDNLLNEG